MTTFLQTGAPDASVAIAAIAFAGTVAAGAFALIRAQGKQIEEMTKTNGKLVSSLEAVLPLLQAYLVGGTPRRKR